MTELNIEENTTPVRKAPKPPKKGTISWAVWEVANSELEKHGEPLSRPEFLSLFKTSGLNMKTVSTQYAMWLKYNFNE